MLSTVIILLCNRTLEVIPSIQLLYFPVHINHPVNSSHPPSFPALVTAFILYFNALNLFSFYESEHAIFVFLGLTYFSLCLQAHSYIHIARNDGISFFMTESFSSSITGHIGQLYILANMNSATINLAM